MQHPRLQGDLGKVPIETFLMRNRADGSPVLVLPAIPLVGQHLVVLFGELPVPADADKIHRAFRSQLLLRTLEIVSQLAGTLREVLRIARGQLEIERRPLEPPPATQLSASAQFLRDALGER